MAQTHPPPAITDDDDGVARGRAIRKYYQRNGGLRAAAFADAANHGRSFDDGLVLVDEAHLLLLPEEEEDGKERKDRFSHLSRRIYDAKNAVVVLFTATPVTTTTTTTTATTPPILRLVKGAEYKDAATNEGFVTWFMSRPTAMFATIENMDGSRSLPNVTKVYTDPVGVTAAMFDAMVADCTAEFVREGRSSDDGRDFAPALTAKMIGVARSIVPGGGVKTLILAHRRNGLRTLVRVLEVVAGVTPLLVGNAPPDDPRSGGDADVIERFNRAPLWNDEGRRPDGRVLVAAAEDYSEGVSFVGVRRLILADFYVGHDRPPSATRSVQQLGRAVRACSHAKLPKEQQRLRVDLFVAVERPPSVSHDCKMLTVLLKQADDIQRATEHLRNCAIDRDFYD